SIDVLRVRSLLVRRRARERRGDLSTARRGQHALRRRVACGRRRALPHLDRQRLAAVAFGEAGAATTRSVHSHRRMRLQPGYGILPARSSQRARSASRLNTSRRRSESMKPMVSNEVLRDAVLKELDSDPEVDAKHIWVTATDGAIALGGHVVTIHEKHVAV